MLYLVLFFSLAKANEISLCPPGTFAFGDGTCALCPKGFTAIGNDCVLDCDPESDVSCGKSTAVRRRLGIFSNLKKHIEDFFSPHSSTVLGMMVGQDNANNIQKMASCVRSAVSIANSHLSYSIWLLQKAVESVKENDAYREDLYYYYAGQYGKYGLEQIGNACAAAFPDAKGQFGNVLSMMMSVFAMHGRRRLDGKPLTSRRIAELTPGGKYLGDGEYQISFTEDDIQHMAQQMLARDPKSGSYSAQRRQELLEEHAHMFRGVLHNDRFLKADDVDELKAPNTNRRIDSGDFTTMLHLVFTLDAGTYAQVGSVDLGMNDDWEYFFKSFKTKCTGRTAELGGMALDVGISYIDEDDILGHFSKLSFGVDFFILEVGGFFELIKNANNQVVAGGFGAGIGFGLNPIDYENADCETVAHGSSFSG